MSAGGQEDHQNRSETTDHLAERAVVIAVVVMEEQVTEAVVIVADAV